MHHGLLPIDIDEHDVGRHLCHLPVLCSSRHLVVQSSTVLCSSSQVAFRRHGEKLTRNECKKDLLHEELCNDGYGLKFDDDDNEQDKDDSSDGKEDGSAS